MHPPRRLAATDPLEPLQAAAGVRMRVTQRRHRDDLALTATGEQADRWLDLAQAFAGEPGAGRPPAGRGGR